MLRIIVPGGLNTDIKASGVKKIAAKGELVVGEKIEIGPGGKSRNVAQMIAALMGPGIVAMIGKTAKDPFGFWKIPLDALKESGVNIANVKILDFAGVFPGIALIPVDRDGGNQIYLLPGINNDFNREDIDDSVAAFQEAGGSAGILPLSLELPLDTALYAVEKAKESGLKVVLDPGGMIAGTDYTQLLQQDIFLLKPNEHEAEMLTGVKVTDLQTAQSAGQILLNSGVKNVLITAGVNGAYLITPSSAEHLPIPEIAFKFGDKDETGCGDQAMATICAFIAEGKEVREAARLGIVSGTLQFYKPGIIPVTKEELLAYL